jgi:glycosyltransferase involved in cell wall biosynthesis
MATSPIDIEPARATPERCGDASPASGTAALTTRVLHVINGEHYAGAERVQDLLAARLPELGFDVGFAYVKPGRFGQSRTARHVPLIDAAMRHRFDLRPAWRLGRLIHPEGYALVHAHTPRSALIGAVAAARAGVPFVYHVHSPAARDSTRRLQNWINAKSERFSIRRAARLITVSPSLREQMIADGFPASRVAFVANGVPSVPYDATRRPPAGRWTLGTVALFRPRKGIEVLLQAVAKLRAAGEDVRLRAVGPFETPGYERDVMALVGQLDIEDAIEWTGFTDNVHAQLAMIDLFVLPSLFGEGLPMVVLEAMAAGLPVVATDVEGIPVAIRHGEEGVLIPPGDANTLALGITRIVRGELDWMTLRQNAHRRHTERFSDRAMAEGVAAVYREVLGAAD